jgi:pyruvate dehydrogenase E2 component (dihydrolipoamide acetyltransferase)
MSETATPITMPDLATTGSAVRILRWLVKPGEAVTRGQPLLEVETDKAAMEVESIVTGTLVSTHFAEGDEVSAGAVMAVVNAASPAPSPVRAAAPTQAAAPVSAPPKPANAPTGMFARNRAKAAAQTPSAATAAAPRPSFSPAQKVAARRLQQSKQTIPHFYLQLSANAGSMLAQRQAALPEKPAWDAFFVRAVAVALKQYDRFGYRFEDAALVPQNSDAIGVAVDVADDLRVITIAQAATKTVAQISAEIRAAADKLRRGESLPQSAQSGGAVTITNLGSTGVETFSAIINPPEAAILAIGAVAPQLVPVDGQAVVQHRVQLTLSADHRVVNGKYAAGFLAAIVREIETP